MSAMEANTAVANDVLLDVQGLSVEYASPGTTPVTAVENVSFSLLAGETLAVEITGEDGELGIQVERV